MIRFTDSIDGIKPCQLSGGFWEGWPNHPSPERHLMILANSYAIWLAVDDVSGKVVGFINALSDGILSAYIPLLEVLPEYSGRGIGSELVQRMLGTLNHLYMIDLLCDEDIQPFYERLGMHPWTGAIARNYDRQAAGAVVND